MRPLFTYQNHFKIILIFKKYNGYPKCFKDVENAEYNPKIENYHFQDFGIVKK